IRDAVGHPGGEVAAHRSQDHDDSARHVLAAVVAGAFDDGDCARIPHRKPVAGAPRGKEPSGGGAIERGVAEQNVRTGAVPGTAERPDDDLAAAQPFAYVIVGLALEMQMHARQRERATALTGAAAEADPQRRDRALAPMFAREVAGDAP